MDELRAELMRAAALVVLSLTVGCNDGQPREIVRAFASSSGSAAVHVDSILPPAEALDRFFGTAERPTALAGGAGTTSDLVHAFFAALAKRDSAALSRMVVSRAEYGALYYPGSVYSTKPYELAPDIAWMLNSESSAKGLRRLLRRLGGHRLTVTAFECDKESHEGRNRFSQECHVTYRDGGSQPETRRLFRAIMEREGRAKFLSYSGDF